MTPPIIPFSDFDSDWARYEEELYNIFTGTISNAGLTFQKDPVNARRIPEEKGRWACFWHLISEGHVEENRTPDLSRCERLPWVAWVIQNAEMEPSIDVWMNKRRGKENCILWLREEYVVILARRTDYWLLRSAYCTTYNNTIRRFRKERDAYYAENTS